jgi:hypothetical protein
MIVDALLFNDELSLLQHRITWLRDYVDITIVLEADFTFSGKPKSLFAKSAFAQLVELTEGKVVLLQMTKEAFEGGGLPYDPWKIEFTSRDLLVKHLSFGYPGHRVIFSDLDEIPSLEQMKVISKLDLDGSVETFSIPMQTYYRYANWHLVGPGETWNAAKTFNSSFAPAVSEIRSFNKFINLPEIGSHLSYLAMTAQEITNKFESFSHSELSGFGNIEDIITGISDFYFVDHIGRFNSEGRGLIQVLNENQIHDVCEYLVRLDAKFFRGGETPPTYKRLVASAVITYLRMTRNAQKSIFYKFVERSIERNQDRIGTFSGLVILAHVLCRNSTRKVFISLKQLIPTQIKLRIKNCTILHKVRDHKAF